MTWVRAALGVFPVWLSAIVVAVTAAIGAGAATVIVGAFR